MVDQIIVAGLDHLAEPRVEALLSEIDQVMEESRFDSSAATIAPETAAAAVEFAKSLPWSLPSPKVAPDPDGEILFDWFGPSGKMFSVSVDHTGRVAYAGRYGDKSKVHGVEQLSAACPQEIVRGISKAIR